MTSLIAEDLLWLLHDDDTGRALLARPVIDRLLAGAILLEATGPDPDHLGVETSCVALPREFHTGRGLRESLLCRLVDAGKVRRARVRRLGMFAVDAFPTADARGKRRLRTAVRRALLDSLRVDRHTEALIVLLSTIRATDAYCAGWSPELVERAARAYEYRYISTAAAEHVKRAVCIAQAGIYTGAA
ncbi:GPP34 family phosphoprotein [Nocardia sp. NPDC005825]|uniref:GPP34 family phosphoprotein n=1 Tax=unclassified Nocardia TaxID=2637762 RepID=UPI0033E3ACEC